MKILFFIEPVIYWKNHIQLAAHLIWLKSIIGSINSDDEVMLASNPSVIAEWTKENDNKNISNYPIDPYKPLEICKWSKAIYSKNLYVEEKENPYLEYCLNDIRAVFSPDIVVSTSQNSYVDKVFCGIPKLHVEQAPLPRFDQPFRTMFDPCGHQVGSILEKRADEIKNIPLDEDSQIQILRIIANLRERLLQCAEARPGIDIIEDLRLTSKIAILATQPPNWVTYEGAYREIDIEGLLCEWEQRLPSGWIGIPTFHAGYRLPQSLEQHLMASGRRLRFLPQSVAQGLSEPLVAAADALISISSTTSITGIMLGKPTVVVGRCAFSAWCGSDINKLNELKAIDQDIVVRLVAFICHRLSFTSQQLSHDPGFLRELLALTIGGDSSGDWQMDFRSWTPDILKEHFPELWSLS